MKALAILRPRCHRGANVAQMSLARLRGALTSQEIAKYVEYCLKPGKAPGPDKCPNEPWKTMSDEEILIVQVWVNEILTLPKKTIDTSRQSRSTISGTIFQVHKGGSTNKMSDRRAVVLLNSGYQQVNISRTSGWNRSWNMQMFRTKAGWGQAGWKCQHRELPATLTILHKAKLHKTNF